MKTKIRDAMQNYKESDESLASQCKFRIITNFSSLMQDFNDVIEYTLVDMQKELDKDLAETQDGSGSGLRVMPNTSNPMKDFDFLLDNPSKNELERLLM